MKRVILIVVVILMGITSCNRMIHKRPKCKGNGNWYRNRNLSNTSLQRSIIPTKSHKIT